MFTQKVVDKIEII